MVYFTLATLMIAMTCLLQVLRRRWRREAMTPRLYRLDRGLTEVTLKPGGLSIGSAPVNDVCIRNLTVSKMHARIRSYAGRFVIEDLDSHSGVWVQGRRVTRAVLTPGVPFLVGNCELMLLGGNDTSPIRSHTLRTT
jgi:pSer/pThr/pTyr-binding forkhead associated (FHA) protein